MSKYDALFNRLRRDDGSGVGESYARRADEIRLMLFPQQLALIEDPCRFKAARCPRRAGKSTGSIGYMLDTALREPGAQVLYITLTRGMAKRIAWPALKRMCRQLDLGAEFHETDLIARLQNGSWIQLAGAETIGDIDKFRGADGGYDLVIIDECKSFSAALFGELLDEVLVPALADRMGTLLIIGTPGKLLVGPFYDITGPKAFRPEAMADGWQRVVSRPFDQRTDDKWDDVKFAWSFHAWSTKDNTAKPHLWTEQLATKERNGWTDEDPRWRREYLGEWVADDTGFVYRYLPERNDWDGAGEGPFGLPEGHEWRFVLGMDLGFDDDFDIEVAAWSETCPEFYHVEGYAMPSQNIADIAAKLAEFIGRYGEFDIMVGDRGGLGKVILASLAEMYGLNIEPAEKTEKRDHIELLNSDLLAGRCKVRAGSTLAYQMSTLQWDEKNPKIEERDTPNHACDAFVYVWRYCFHHFWRRKAESVTADSPEYWKEKMREAMERYEAKKRRHDEMDWDEKVAESMSLDPVPGEGWNPVTPFDWRELDELRAWMVHNAVLHVSVNGVTMTLDISAVLRPEAPDPEMDDEAEPDDGLTPQQRILAKYRGRGEAAKGPGRESR